MLSCPGGAGQPRVGEQLPGRSARLCGCGQRAASPGVLHRSGLTLAPALPVKGSHLLVTLHNFSCGRNLSVCPIPPSLLGKIGSAHPRVIANFQEFIINSDVTQERCDQEGETLWSANTTLRCCKPSLRPSGLTVAVGDRGQELWGNHQGLGIPRDNFALCHVRRGSTAVQCHGMGGGDAWLVAKDMACCACREKCGLCLKIEARR